MKVPQLLSTNTFGLLREDCWSDGYVSRGYSTDPIAKCPHCVALVWLQECESCELSEAALSASTLSRAEERKEFEVLDGLFHPEMPVAGFRTNFWQDLTFLRQRDIAPHLHREFHRRSYFALQLIRKDNHQERRKYEPIRSASTPTLENPDQRAFVLRALIESVLDDADSSESAALAAAEWFRQAGDWTRARAQMKRTFHCRENADLAAQMRVLIDCRVRTVVVWALSEELLEVIKQESAAERDAIKLRTENKRREELRDRSPRNLLNEVSNVDTGHTGLELLELRLPDPLRTIMRSNVRGYHWPVDEVPRAVCQAVLQLCGAPFGLHSNFSADLINKPVNQHVLDFLIHALTGSTWDHWSYSPVGMTPPNLKGPALPPKL